MLDGGLVFKLQDGLVGVLVGALIGGLARRRFGALVCALIGGLDCWLIGGLVWALAGVMIIALVIMWVRINYSWGGYVLIGVLVTGVAGVQVGRLVSVLIFGQGSELTLVSVLVGGLVWALGFAFFHMLNLYMEEYYPVELIGVLIGGLVGMPIGALTGGPGGWVIGALVGTLSFVFGGALAAVLQFYILRFWLWQTHAFPWKAESFLEDATARILLRRVGGDYSFIHRLLLDYFADLEKDDA